MTLTNEMIQYYCENVAQIAYEASKDWESSCNQKANEKYVTVFKNMKHRLSQDDTEKYLHRKLGKIGFEDYFKKFQKKC